MTTEARPLDTKAAPEPLDRGRAVVLVAADAQFKGLITFRGASRIDGNFRGEIAATGRLELGERSRVEADIEADEIVLAGAFEGRVVARSRLELLASARVKGEFSAPRVTLAEGCQVFGHCRSGESAKAVGLQQSSS